MRRANVSCWHTICSAKSIFRFCAILQCVIIQALVIGFFFVVLLFPTGVLEFVPPFLKSQLFSLENPQVAFYAGIYGLTCSQTTSWPFFIVAIQGSKSKCWLIFCIASTIFIMIHFMAFWVINLICANAINLALIISTVLIITETIVMIMSILALRARISESQALHQATLLRAIK